ncbi:MAG: GGDEF domain-containing protein [Rhodospirillales bacterium]|nr:GGDEF domain-containing protein [Rhodospirillales bacterium]
MEIPEAEFTPKVRAAIMALMAEVEKLRRELQQNQSRIAYLEDLADQDTLTPVANRRAFVRELSRMQSFAERYDTPSSVIYFDVNGLKKINDTLGHGAGDAVLAHVANSLVQNIRDSDFVGRLGGDEFGVILAYTDQIKANEKAASLAEAISSQSVTWEDNKIAVAVSYGTYAFRGGEDAARAIDAADRAMYARKKGELKSG